MSNQNWNSLVTKKHVGIVSLEQKVKVNITKTFLDKVKFLCSNIAKVEWSGVLFYKMEGTIRNPDDLLLTPIDVLLMDKGTQGFTSYDFNEEVSEFQMDQMQENPEFIDYKIGHIHSHNVMNVFFSGTDNDELSENAENHNFYFSLIVNNFMEMIAKVVFHAVPVRCTALDENGEEYFWEVEEMQPYLFSLECDITKPEVEFEVDNLFANRLKLIEVRTEEREAKEKAQAEAKRIAALNSSKKVSYEPPKPPKQLAANFMERL